MTYFGNLNFLEQNRMWWACQFNMDTAFRIIEGFYSNWCLNLTAHIIKDPQQPCSLLSATFRKVVQEPENQYLQVQ